MKRALTIGSVMVCLALVAVASPRLRVFNWSAVGTNTVRIAGHNEAYKLVEIRGAGVYPIGSTNTSTVTISHANGVTSDTIGVFTNGSIIVAPTGENYVGPLDSFKIESTGITSGVFRCVCEAYGD